MDVMGTFVSIDSLGKVHTLVVLASKGLKSGDATANNECMDVMGTFVSIDSLQVHNMSDYMVLIRNTVSAQHISSSSGDVQCFPTIITFQNRDHLWSQFASILQSANLKAALKAKGNFGNCICHFLLHDLIIC